MADHLVLHWNYRGDESNRKYSIYRPVEGSSGCWTRVDSGSYGEVLCEIIAQPTATFDQCYWMVRVAGAD